MSNALLRAPRVAELVCYYPAALYPTPVPALVTRVCGAPPADHFTLAPYDVPVAGDIDLVALTAKGPEFITDVPNAKRLVPYDVSGVAFWQRLEEMPEEKRQSTACREVLWRHPDFVVRTGEVYQWWAAYTLTAHADFRDLFVLRPDLECGWSYDPNSCRWVAAAPMTPRGEQVGTRVVYFGRDRRELVGVLVHLYDNGTRELLLFDTDTKTIQHTVASEDDSRAYVKPIGIRTPGTYTQVSW
jgi:hypothetical protein